MRYVINCYQASTRPKHCRTAYRTDTAGSREKEVTTNHVKLPRQCLLKPIITDSLVSFIMADHETVGRNNNCKYQPKAFAHCGVALDLVLHSSNIQHGVYNFVKVSHELCFIFINT